LRHLPPEGEKLESAKGAKGEDCMREFIKIKNDTGDGEMIIKAASILRVCDREEGGAVVEYGENFNSNGVNYEVFRTASTAAEVLAAIEGTQEPRPNLVFMSKEECEAKHGKAAFELLRVGNTQAPPSDELRAAIEDAAPVCSMLSKELTNITGKDWTVTFYPSNNDFNGRWFHTCVQHDTHFQHELESHYLSFWGDMSEFDRNVWVRDAAGEVLHAWRESPEY
jgi:hypothetical protein